MRHKGDAIVDKESIDKTVVKTVDVCYAECKCVLYVAHLTDVIQEWDQWEEDEIENRLKEDGIYVRRKDFCFVGKHTTGEPDYFHLKCEEERYERIMEDHAIEIELLKM